VRVTAGGAKSYILNYRAGGVERRLTIGSCDTWSAVAAVRHARELRQAIDLGKDPLAEREAEAAAAMEAAGQTVASVLDAYVASYARKRLRRWQVVESVFRRLVVPAVGKLPVHELNRGHIARMLDKIENESGPVMADRTRAYLSSCLAWFAERDEEFNYGAVMVKQKRRSTNASRSRVLTDDELRAVWQAAGEGGTFGAQAGTFGALVRLLLLTAARRTEVAGMMRSEIDAAGVWTLPAVRSKNKRPLSLPLSKAARAVIEAQPKVGDYVFSSSTGGEYVAYSRGKLAMDGALGDAVQPWVLHDLRRTARSLMSRAGVRPDVAERVLNHAIQGVAAVYDRHSYQAEMGAALEALASMVERIVNPPAANVVSMRREG